MQVERFILTPTTDASGNATVYTPNTTGRVLGIAWVKPGSGGITGATFTITAEATGEAILTASSVSASASYYPRVPTVSTANAAALYAAAGTAVNDHLYISNDRVKIVVASGGNTLTGTFHILIG
jgi:hypothetical protein